jgi:VWFA-related protein
MLLALAHASLAAVFGPQPRPQQPSPQVPVFGTEVQLITVDAVVLDKERRPVPGLTRDDFVVMEDGQRVEIVRFEAFAQADDEPPPPDAALGVVATNEPRARASGRAFAVVVDDLNIAPERSEDARRSVSALLEDAVRAGDDVVVGTTSGDVWWSARIPEGRADLRAVAARVRGKYEERFSFNQMTEYEAWRIAHYEDSPSIALSTPGNPSAASGGRASGGAEPLPAGVGGVSERVRRRWEGQMLCLGSACSSMLRGRAMQVDAARRARVQGTLSAVTRALEALRPIRGRKSLLLLSEGFLTDPQDRREREVVALSREANTAIYFLDVRGLGALPSAMTAADAGPGPGVPIETVAIGRGAAAFEESVLSSTGSEGLASDTGGFSVRNTNDLGAGASRIADESRVFYLLGFNAAEGRAPRAWRKLQVTTTRPGLVVRARKGYTLASAAPAPKPPKKGEPRRPDPAVIRAVDSPHEATGLPLRARAYVLERGSSETRVLLATEFDTSGLGALSRARRLEMSAVVRMRDQPVERRYDQAVELKAEATETPWRAVVREFGLPAGVAMARIVLRDPETDALGSVSLRFEVPERDRFRLSTPILSGRIEPARGAGERPRPALTVERAFPRDAGLYCQFEVLGASPGPDDRPRVRAGITVWSAAGRMVREAPPTPVATDQDGRAVRLVGIDLAGLPEGEYDLVLDVKDEQGDGHIRQRERFSITAPADASRTTSTR